MKSRLYLFAFALIGAAVAVQAADVTGKWTAQVPGRGGQTRETTFHFKADAEKLTGTTSGMQGDVEIQDGKVKGDEVSFHVKLSFQGNQVKVIYKGKLVAMMPSASDAPATIVTPGEPARLRTRSASPVVPARASGGA